MTVERKLIHWLYIHQAVASLVRLIKQRELKIDAIVAVSRGGMIPAVMLSHALDVRTVAAVQVKSYDEEHRQRPIISSAFDSCWNSPSTLIVDDIIDTGKTFDFLIRYYPKAEYCALVDKCCHRAMSAIVETRGRWIVFPWEAPYTEEMRTIREESISGDELS